MSNSATIRWGILAPGRIAHKFAHDLALVPGAKLHAVASRSPERAREFAAQYGAPHAFGSYEELVHCPGLDVVYVASPHSEHCTHALLCLENGIPVLCEKAFALNLAQARRMVDAARSRRVFLMEALWTRFIPLFDKTLELLHGGIIGNIKTVRADFGFKATFPPEHRVFNPALGGGSLLDVGIYTVYLATQLLGKPDAVQAAAVFNPVTGADDSCGMLLRYGSGQMALLDCSLVIKTDTEAYIYGENGMLRLHNRFINPQDLSINFYDKPAEHLHLPYTGWGYFHEIEEVHRCLRAGHTESDKMPLDFSLTLMEVLDSIRQVAGISYPGVD